jgi:hypothetical protein
VTAAPARGRGRGRIVAGLLAITAVGAAVSWVGGQWIGGESIDLSVGPRVLLVTDPFAVGATYTLGETAVPSEVKRPVRITGISVVRVSGLEILGFGAMDSAAAGIGLVPGWPPPAPYLMRDPLEPAAVWEGHVQVLIGIRTTAPKSGLRGVRLLWTDGDGRPGSRVFDTAVLTCAPDACDLEPDAATEALLRELGLRR